MSTTFQTASPSLQKLDPAKRVNYTFGLVLGVEEFLQADAYFLAKHHLENRLLHGYGTVCGLDVSVQTSPVLEVQVSPGWAISPKGQEIRVPQVMCVQVNQWLSANSAALSTALGSMPPVLNLCIILCYRECKTDIVPIPGEPCSSTTSSTAPSRIVDTFELMLCLDRVESPPLSSPPASPSGSSGLCEFRPLQLEDDAVKALAMLLQQLQVSTTGPFLTLAQLEQLVRDLAAGSPPYPGSPPPGPPYAVQASDLANFQRAALRSWITEVRPFINSAEGSGPCCPPPERCVLLAELAVTLGPGWIASSVSVDDSRRPFLVPTRLLQEMALAGQGAATPASTAYHVAAAGFFQTPGGGAVHPSLNGLTATPGANGTFVLKFPAYSATANYIVKGTVTDTAGLQNAIFELVGLQADGIHVRVFDVAGKALTATVGFMAEISQIGGAA